jgi:RNA polymerase sigma factor (sigma-70 family)
MTRMSMTGRESDRSLEELAARANAGDRAALNELLARVRHPMYRLALRFLGNPADAEDVTQEILVRLTTRLSTFEGRSAFTTWAYTVAVRMLLRTRKRLFESSVVSAERFAAFLDAGLADVVEESGRSPEQMAVYQELCDEVRVSCTYGMLLCLSRPVRAAYLLGDVLGVTDVEGAEICDTTPAAFRKRLERGRRTIRQIIEGRCGLVEPAHSCRCSRQIDASITSGILDPNRLAFARHPRVDAPIDRDVFEAAAAQIDAVVAIGELYQRDRFAAPSVVWEQLRAAMPELIDATPTDR